MAFEIIVIGTSKGGLQALKVVLSALPTKFSLPVVIVQHRESESDTTLCHLLQQVCLLPVVDAEDKQPILPGQIYLAPGGYHLLIESDFLPTANCQLPPSSPPATLPFPQRCQ